MKRILIFLFAVMLLAACSAAPTVTQSAVDNSSAPVVETGATPIPTEAAILVTDYEDATNLRNQLSYGTLLLEKSPQAVTPEQAKTLLPLWQAMLALSGDSTTASEEITAVQDQIVTAMQPEQLQAIAEMKITNTQLTDYYASMGIAQPTPVPGVTKVPGSKKDMSDEDKQATRTANEAAGTAATGTGQLTKTLLYDEVIRLLTTRAIE